MKRIISIILAIALVAAMLPTFAFAAEGDAEGIRIKYDIQGVVQKLGLTWESSSSSEAAKLKRVPFSVLNFEASNGFFNFRDSSTGLFSGHSDLNYNDVIGFQISNGDWISFDIFVPKAGTYTMEMWCGNYWKHTTTDVYINGVIVGGYDNYEEGTVEKNPTEGQIAQFKKVVDEPRYVEGFTFDKAGIYTIKFGTSGTYCTLGTFYLVENGTGTENCLATIVADADRNILPLGAGETATIKTLLYMADGSTADASAYPVSFRSDNEAVATVSASGVVTPVSAGKANITAYTTNEFGEEVYATKEIEVLDGITVKYDVIKHFYTDLGYTSSTPKADGSLANLTETVTDGFYSYDSGTAYDGNYVKYYERIQLMGKNKSMAFKINVPVAGIYEIATDVYTKNVKSGPGRCDVDMDVYISKSAKSTYPKDKIGSYNCYDVTQPDKTPITKYAGTYNFEEPGVYYVNFVIGKHYQPDSGTPYSYIGSFYLIGGNKNALMKGEISASASEINKDNGETATVSATGFLSKDASAATFTYSSSDTSIATVDATSGLVTPIKEGKVTITATADAVNKLTTEITVTENKPGEEVADTMVSVYISALEGGKVETNLESEVAEVEIGTKVLAEATANEGYEFAYWADSNGKVLSTNARETFTINVNTSAKAVFEKIATEADTTAPVYFYNGNGGKLATETVEKGTTFADVKKPTATLTGFAFDKWSIADDAVINNLTRAVALFKDTDKTYSVKVGSEVVASGKKYGEDVTITATEENFTCWKLGDKIVSYSPTYKFHVYGNMEFTKVCEGADEAIPTVILEKVDGEYFLTYNVPAGYTKVEAGILFANSGTPTIESFYAKATEQTGSGQFTAKPNESETIARGYIIFKNGTDIRVIYAD